MPPGCGPYAALASNVLVVGDRGQMMDTGPLVGGEGRRGSAGGSSVATGFSDSVDEEAVMRAVNKPGRSAVHVKSHRSERAPEPPLSQQDMVQR